MKKSFIFLLLLFLLVPRVSFAKIVFTEVAWMGTAASQYGEWIELFNDGDSELDLEGAVLSEGGGSVPIFTLTKKIPAKGYYIVERTTATSLDPVPEKNDDAGAFGGSGLANTGEFLVLKDKSGALLASLDASAGWPAGDSSTKETMQWNGTAWITALPTPGAVTSGVTATPSADVPATSGSSSDTAGFSPSNTPAPSSHVGGASVAPVLKLNDPLFVQAGRDRLGFVGVPLVFIGKGFVGSPDSLVRNPSFAWSFGDGGFATGAVVEHVFEFPGEYIVILNGSWGEEVSTARSKVTIVAPKLAITKVERGSRPFIEITNRSSIEVNLWKATLRAGFFSFPFPADTIIAPGGSVAFAKQITGLEPKEGDEVALVWPGGRVSAALTLAPEEKMSDVGELERTVASLQEQIKEVSPPPVIVARDTQPALLIQPVAPRKVQIAVKPEAVVSPASSSPRVIEIPKPAAETGGIFSWPGRALAFIGGLIFGN